MRAETSWKLFYSCLPGIPRIHSPLYIDISPKYLCGFVFKNLSEIGPLFIKLFK